MKKLIAVVMLIFAFQLPNWAQNGELLPDSSFNFNSFLITDSFATNKLHVMANGKILCVGFKYQTISPGVYNHSFNVSCLLPDASVDATFAVNGHLTIDNGFNDEKFFHIKDFDSGFLLVGQYNDGDCYILKIDPTGTIDISFGNNGAVSFPLNTNDIVSDVKLSVNNDIFVLINCRLYQGFTAKGKIVKLNAQGIIDTSFGNQGIAELPLYHPLSMSVLGDGSLVVLGSDTSAQLQPCHPPDFKTAFLCKMYPSGSLDSTYGINGKQIISYGDIGFRNFSAISFDSGFYIYGAENCYNSSSFEPYTVYKVNFNGNFDNTFSGDGRAFIRVPMNQAFFPWPITVYGLSLYNDDLWLFGYTEIKAQNCLRKMIIRVTQFGVQDSTKGPWGFSAEPIFDHVLEDSTYNAIFCAEQSMWFDIAFQEDGKILATGLVSGPYPLTATPDGSIIARLIPSGLITEVRKPIPEKQLAIYPNPTSDFINIESSGKRVIITDYTGKHLLTAPLNNEHTRIDVSALANGIYFIIFDDRRAMKFIVQK